MLVPIQDVDRRVQIPIHRASALRARVPPDREVFGNQHSTAATGLGGVAWADLDDGAASFFRFACTQSRQGSPGRIQNTLVESTFGGGTSGQKRARLFVLLGFGCGTHVHDLKVFKHQGAVCVDQAARGLVQEILSAVARLSVQPGQLALGAIAPMAAPLPTREFLVRLLDLFLRGPRDARVVNDNAVGEHGVRLQAKSTAYDFRPRSIPTSSGEGWKAIVGSNLYSTLKQAYQWSPSRLIEQVLIVPWMGRCMTILR